MSATDTIEQLLAQRGWAPRGDAQPEGRASRLSVTTEAGEAALLYVYGDERSALRAGLAHQRAGEQMFAVPERLESGPMWLLVQHPAGRPLSEVVPQFEGDRAVIVAESLGQVVRKLHELPCEAFCGDLVEAGEGGERWLTFSGYVAHHLEWFSENMRQREFDADADALTSAIGDLRHELSAFHPRNPVCLCHGRLELQHIWVDQAGREVVGLTGFDCAAQTPRDADVAHLLWIAELGDERVIRAFYNGYGAARTMDVQRRERFFRRLVAFQALFGAKGDVRLDVERLVTLTSPLALG